MSEGYKFKNPLSEAAMEAIFYKGRASAVTVMRKFKGSGHRVGYTQAIGILSDLADAGLLRDRAGAAWDILVSPEEFAKRTTTGGFDLAAAKKGMLNYQHPPGPFDAPLDKPPEVFSDPLIDDRPFIDDVSPANIDPKLAAEYPNLIGNGDIPSGVSSADQILPGPSTIRQPELTQQIIKSIRPPERTPKPTPGPATPSLVEQVIKSADIRMPERATKVRMNIVEHPAIESQQVLGVDELKGQLEEVTYRLSPKIEGKRRLIEGVSTKVLVPFDMDPDYAGNASRERAKQVVEAIEERRRAGVKIDLGTESLLNKLDKSLVEEVRNKSSAASAPAPSAPVPVPGPTPPPKKPPVPKAPVPTPGPAGAPFTFKHEVLGDLGSTPEELVEDLFSHDSQSYRSGIYDYISRSRLVGLAVNPDEVVDRFKIKNHTLLFDLEATGVGKMDEMVQFAGMVVNPDMTIGQHMDLLAKNNKGFDPGAAATLKRAGITEDLLKESGLERADARQKIIDFLESIHAQHGKVDIMGQNARFDIRLLRKELGNDFDKYFTGNIIDTMAFSAFADSAKRAQMGGASLERVAKFFGIDTGVSHTATDDVKTTYKVYRKLIGMFGQSPGDDAAVDAVKFTKISPILGNGLKSEINKMIGGTPGPIKGLGLLAAGALAYTLLEEDPQEDVIIRKPVIIRENPDIMNIDNSESKIRDQHSKYPFNRKSYEMNDPIGSHRERGGTFV